MLGTTHVKEETSILQGGKTYLLLLPVSPCLSQLLNFMYDISLRALKTFVKPVDAKTQASKVGGGLLSFFTLFSMVQ